MKKQLTVWLLQTGEPLHCDAGQPRPMRAMNLANALVDAGHKVVLWLFITRRRDTGFTEKNSFALALS
jgi:hypothetical protein